MKNLNEVDNVNTQIAFTSALLFSVSIGLYALYGYRDILINKQNSKFSNKYLYELGLLSAMISLLVTKYFFIISDEKYENKSSSENFNSYMAATLSLLAQSIRVNTQLKNPYVDEGQIQDVI